MRCVDSKKCLVQMELGAGVSPKSSSESLGTDTPEKEPALPTQSFPTFDLRTCRQGLLFKPLGV